MNITTYQDLIDHLVDFCGGDPGQNVVRDARRSILNGYRELAHAHTWSYLMRHGRIMTSTPYVTGTIQYQHTSGSVPYLVTLTGGTFPSWAAAGYIRIGLVGARCSRLLSPTTLQVDSEVNFGFDYAPGQGYTLYQDTYELPDDFMFADQLLYELNFGGMDYIPMKEWLFENRYIFAQGVPQQYTITGDPQYPGRMVVRISPFPNLTKTIDFPYLRRPRDLKLAQVSAGSVSLSAASNAVVGVGTSFSQNMVGSCIRVSLNPQAFPTSLEGENPADFESIVDTVTDATHLTTEDNSAFNFSGCKYTVSDVADVEAGAMTTLLKRYCEKEMAIARRMKDMAEIEAMWKAQLAAAKSSDSRSYTGRTAGPMRPFRQRLRDMPIDLVTDN